MSSPHAGRRNSEHSAGGVVVRPTDEGFQLLVIRPRGTDRWQLPKGGLHRGESSEDAAVREVREEGGVDARILRNLDSIRYFYHLKGRRIAKVVDFYLMLYLAGDTSDHDHEVDEACWIPLDSWSRLTFPSERKLAEQARSIMESASPE